MNKFYVATEITGYLAGRAEGWPKDKIEAAENLEILFLRLRENNRECFDWTEENTEVIEIKSFWRDGEFAREFAPPYEVQKPKPTPRP